MNVIRIVPLVICALALILNSCAVNKNRSSEVKPASSVQNGIDSVLINCKTELPSNLENRIFPAQKNGKLGWMNVLGEWVISPEYDTLPLLNWSEGLNVCKKEGKYGVINYKNEVVIPFIYNTAPTNCEQGMIAVTNNEGAKAYFDKQGKQLCAFSQERLPRFKHGLAVVRANRKRIGRYPRRDLENRTSDLFSTDFLVLNSQFDTLLNFKGVPFAVDFGSLSDGYRTFFIFPLLGKHADIGVSYGKYGYLDEKGELVIPPKFEAKDIFTRLCGGAVRDADAAFTNGFAQVREGDAYYFIDKSGNKTFDIEANGNKICDLSNFNNAGLAAYRAGPNTLLVDTLGNILFESKASGENIGIQGNSWSFASDFLIPIVSRIDNVINFYTPAFESIGSVPLKDTFFRYNYSGFIDGNGRIADNNFCILSKRVSTSREHYIPPTKKIIDVQNKSYSTWFPTRSVLNIDYGNFSFLDSNQMINTLYNFNKQEVYSCDSCSYALHNSRLGVHGVYEVYLKDKSTEYVNFKGVVLSDRADIRHKGIIDLTEQIESYDRIEEKIILRIDESEILDLFNQSDMKQKIK